MTLTEKIRLLYGILVTDIPVFCSSEIMEYRLYMRGKCKKDRSLLALNQSQ